MAAESVLGDAQAIHMGSCLFGIPIKLHYTFLFLLVLQVAVSMLLYANAPMYILFVFLLYGPVLLLTTVLHELGHALLTKKLGGQVGGIVLWPLGGIALCGPTEGGAREDLLVSLAGPMMHVPQALFWFIIYAIVTGGDFTHFWTQVVFLDILSSGFAGFMSVLSSRSFWLNVYLLLFNLFIPAYPLDGGRALASALILCGCTVERSAMITAWAAMFIGGGFITLGMLAYFLFFSLNSLLAVVIGVIIFMSGKNLVKLVKEERIREHPLFGRACLQNTVSRREQRGSGGGAAAAAGGGSSAQGAEQELPEAEVV